MHDSLTPLGGLVPLLHMMLNCVFGGKGVGLMNSNVRHFSRIYLRPYDRADTEYLGKKIGRKEMKLVAVCLIIHPLLMLGFPHWPYPRQAVLAGNHKSGIPWIVPGALRVQFFRSKQWFRL